MKLLRLILIASIGSFLMFDSAIARVQPRAIEEIRRLNVLGVEREGILEEFIRERFDDMLAAKDSDQLSTAAAELTLQVKSLVNNEIAYRAYSDKYSEFVQKHHKNVLEKAVNITDISMRNQTRTLVATVLAFCDNPLLIDDILALSNSEQAEIRYWVVKSFSRPDMASFLANGENREEADNIHNAMMAMLNNETDPEVVAQTILSANPAYASGMELINAGLAKRISFYVNWTIQNEKTDLEILKKLVAILQSAEMREGNNREAAIRLARQTLSLYSVGYQRFKMSMYPLEDKTLNLTGANSRAQLLSVMIEGEILFLQMTGNRRQPGFVDNMNRSRNLDRNFKEVFGINGYFDESYERNIYRNITRHKGDLLFKDDTLEYLAVINPPTAEMIKNGENLLQFKNLIEVAK